MIFGNNDDIEVLELEDVPVLRIEKYNEIDSVQNEVKEDSKKKKKKHNAKKATNKKVLAFQYIFCSISLIFIIGCFIFYGSRLFKYYRIYNPKPAGGAAVSLISNEITSKSEIVYEGSGLYISGGNYIYKGNVNNNYLKYNNLLWRIVKINKDDTIDIILDDYINVFNWDSNNNEYIKSNIYNYLNDYYLKRLNKNLLTSFSVCTDKFDKLSELACNNKSDNNYVGLLDVSNFLNSIVDGESYLVNDSEIFWLSNQGSEKIWHTNGVNVSMSEGHNFYEVRPMVTLKATTILYDGDGSKENPYTIEEKNSIGIGSYVKLGEDLWVVYDMEDNIRMTAVNNLEKQYHFSYSEVAYNTSDEGSLAEYLNTTYLESLSYKNLIVESEWYNGAFNNSYEDITSEKVKAKVGILNLLDIKIDSNVNNYLLMTADKKGLVYTYGEVLKSGKSTIYRNVRPCISISKDVKIESGLGSVDNPYVLEV